MGLFKKSENSEAIRQDKEYKDKMKRHIEGYHDEAPDSKSTSKATKNRNKLSFFESIKEYLLFHISARIIYVLIIALLIGALIPLILYWVGNLELDKSEQVFGACQIKTEYRFECMSNQVKSLVNESTCIKNNCCWDTSAEENLYQPYRCYHSYRSQFQYKSISNSENGQNIEVDLEPNQKDIMKNIKLIVTCMNPDQNHIKIQFQDSTAISKQGENESSAGPSKKEVSCGDDLRVVTDETDVFNLEIYRGGTDTDGEAIFDLSVGPLELSNSSFQISVKLQSSFLGLKEAGNLNASTLYGINKFGNVEFPFYMSLEKSGKSHGVLFDTHTTFLVSSVKAPGLLFNFEKAENIHQFDLHVFGGPSTTQVATQVGSYLRSLENDPTNEMFFPPYWSLGLHLCRKSSNSDESFDEIRALTDHKIPYESNCVDEDLRKSFNLNTDKFENMTLMEIEDYLRVQNGIRIVLSQSVLVPVEDEFDPQYLIIDPVTNEPYIGHNGTINFLDIFHPDIELELIERLTESFSEQLPFETVDGLVMIDNSPVDKFIKLACSPLYSTRIWSNITDVKISKDFFYGSLCPELHTYGGELYKNSHNRYGGESLEIFTKGFSEATGSIGDERHLFLSSSVSMNSYKTGGYLGKEVPFTFQGLRESLSHLLRNFLFLPFASTPVCGSFLEQLPPTTNSSNSTTSIEDVEFDQGLCNRWFQLGLLLPFARSVYGGNSSRGILDLSGNFQTYLINQIKERYSLNPYYYTGLYEYQVNYIPLITPLAFYFPHLNETHDIYDQFMIGEGLMALPILNPGSSRSAYFPEGTSWYEMNGRRVEISGYTTVQALHNQYPLYIQNGHIIPTLKPVGKNAEETRILGQYVLLATFPLPEKQNSTGSLYIDDGLTHNNQFDLVTFTCTLDSFTIRTEQCTDQTPNLSKIISEIRIFDFFGRPRTINSTLDREFHDEFIQDEFILKLTSLDINFCNETLVTFYWGF